MVIIVEEDRVLLEMFDELKNGFDVVIYFKKCINMYLGKDCVVRIKFKKLFLDVVIDEMGEDVEFKEDGDDNFIVRFIVKNFIGFIRWIM